MTVGVVRVEDRQEAAQAPDRRGGAPPACGERRRSPVRGGTDRGRGPGPPLGDRPAPGSPASRSRRSLASSRTAWPSGRTARSTRSTRWCHRCPHVKTRDGAVAGRPIHVASAVTTEGRRHPPGCGPARVSSTERTSSPRPGTAASTPRSAAPCAPRRTRPSPSTRDPAGGQDPRVSCQRNRRTQVRLSGRRVPRLQRPGGRPAGPAAGRPP